MSLLPPVSTKLERSVAAMSARLSDIDVPVRHLWSPDTCPEPLLPWLAWSIGIQEWSSSWSETRKRSVLKSAIDVRRQAGTVQAIRDAMAATGVESLEYSEWHEYEGTPGTYRITAFLEDESLDSTYLYRLLRQVDRLSAHLEVIKVDLQSRGKVRKASTAVTGQATTLLPIIAGLSESTGSKLPVLIHQSFLTLSVYPEEP